MTDQPFGSVMRQVHQIVDLPDADQLPDVVLLRHFAERQDGAAFAALVRRHGPMVLSVCRRALDDNHDADDAFQATFLVLMRKAAELRQPNLLANWLYGVACRVARKARTVAGRRVRSSDAVNDMPAPESTPDVEWRELRPVLDEELQRLPDKYRHPLVLHYLEGKTKDETARQLGCNEGTVSSRLARGRDLMRGRLARRGLALTSAALTAILSQNAAPAAVPAALLGSTLKLLSASMVGATETVPASVAALAEGAMQTMHVSKLKIVAAVLLSASLAGAAAAAGGLFTTPPTAEQAAPDAPKTPPRETPANPEQIKGDRVTLVKGNNTFAFDLYAKLGKNSGNFLTSPYSISTALAMTYAGARGPTADEMAKTLHFTLAQDRLHPACGSLVRDLNGEGKKGRGYQLNTANALWGQKDFGFLEDYLNLTQANYGAGLQLVDFMAAREDARKTINAWVEKQTQEKIKDLLKPEDLKPMTRLVLTNAIYLKADWASKFAKESTHDAMFQVSTERKAKVAFMVQQDSFRYLDSSDFQAVELPYADKDLAMVILLPKKVDGLAGLEKQLTADNLEKWLAKLQSTRVAITLPRFKTESRFSLKAELPEMGMPRAFILGRGDADADFSGISGRRNLCIDDVIHQTMIEVNEAGTEAAGATAVIMGTDTGRPKPAEIFRADHPFVYLIRDNRSGSILFLGRLVEPGK